MTTWKRLLAATYRMGSRRRWWAWNLALVLVAPTIQRLLPQPWNWIGTAPFLLFALLLFDGHARWQRDDVRQRTGVTSQGLVVAEGHQDGVAPLGRDVR